MLALGACGGGEPRDEASIDEAYLRDLCRAGDELQSSMLEVGIAVLTDADGEEPDPEAFAELIVDPLTEFIEALRETSPPADMEAFHAVAIEALEGLLDLYDALESGDGDAFDLFGEIFGDAEAVPTPPVAASDRLAEAANDVEECHGSFFLLSFLAGVR